MKRDKIFQISSVSFFLLSCILLLISKTSRETAIFLNGTFGAFFRIFPFVLSNNFGFFIFEFLLLLVPFAFVFSFVYVIKAKSAKTVWRLSAKIVSVFLIFLGAWFLTLGIGYGARKEPMPRNFSAVEIKSLAMSLIEKADSYPQASEDEFSYDEIALIHSSYLAIDDIRLSPPQFVPKLKNMCIPQLLSRLNILGIYSFFTAEIAVNCEAPVRVRRFSAAHEMAHLCGISDEAEADHYAYLALLASGDEALQYSAYITALEFVLAELYKNDAKEYEAVLKALTPNIRHDIQEYRDFLDGNRGAISEMSDKIQGSVVGAVSGTGSVSYSDFFLYLMEDFIE